MRYFIHSYRDFFTQNYYTAFVWLAVVPNVRESSHFLENLKFLQDFSKFLTRSSPKKNFA